MTSFFSHLKQLALNCNYGTTLDETLKEQFIIGLRNDAIKKKLVMEASGKKVDQIFNLATQQETLDREIPIFHSNNASAVHQVQGNSNAPNYSNGNQNYRGNTRGNYRGNSRGNFNNNSRGNKKPFNRGGGNSYQQNSSNFNPNSQNNAGKCMRCGKTNHTSDKCFYKETQCSKCKKIGHLARVCMSGQTQSDRRVHAIHGNESPEDDSESYLLSINLRGKEDIRKL